MGVHKPPIQCVNLQQDMKGLGSTYCSHFVTAGNGLIEFSEFLYLIARTTTNFEETAKHLFMVFDHRGTGFLNKNQLREVLSLDKGLTPRDIEDLLNFFASDADGNVNIDGIIPFFFFFLLTFLFPEGIKYTILLVCQHCLTTSISIKQPSNYFSNYLVGRKFSR